MRSNFFLYAIFTILVQFSFASFSYSQKPNTNANQGPAADSLLIKNVYLISREDTLGDIKVNLLIINKKLQLVTKDAVFFGTGFETLEGEGGFLMGNVAIGEPPSFVILDKNPRENFDIFLNTAGHIHFAMEKGEIVSNKLRNVPIAGNQANQKRITWTAYQPPAMAVPINYYNSRKWNKFNTKIISGLFNGVLALDRLRWLTQGQ